MLERLKSLACIVLLFKNSHTPYARFFKTEPCSAIVLIPPQTDLRNTPDAGNLTILVTETPHRLSGSPFFLSLKAG